MNIYQHNVEKHGEKITKLTNQLNKLSLIRLIAFIGSATLIIILANERQVMLLLITIPLCVFGFGQLINYYQKLANSKRHTTFLKEVNEREILKSANKLSGFAGGETFIDPAHPYAADLDIFGPHSLFQLLNRTTTQSGHTLLAEWLSAPASKEVILGRQQAIKELVPKLDWRQDFQARGMNYENAKSDYKKLLGWIEKPVELLPRQTTYLIVCILLSIVSTAAVVYFFTQLVSSPSDWFKALIYLIIISIINSRFLKSVSHIAEDTIDNTFENVKILGGYQSLITTIEAEKFQSPVLCRLQSKFRQKDYSAAREITRLKNILEMFKQRGTKRQIGRNAMYNLFNTLWLWDIYLILLTEKWKTKNSSYLKDWASAVSEFEVLSSIAGFSYSNPSYSFPHIKEEPYLIRFQTLGHPLISSEKRVCNNFTLEGQGEIAIITGSNMAGKSTFLRTLGVNLILALMGAPCCAEAAEVSNIQLFTSMRTQDNLQEGVSSFYAELRRIEQLLELIKSGKPIFFMLDEMFKGTNSQDRYKGGVSLIKQLSELNAFGIISTHDLELANLAEKHLMVTNYSFNSEIKEGELIFNYALTKGVCKDFNASELMKKSGIHILSTIEEIG